MVFKKISGRVLFNFSCDISKISIILVYSVLNSYDDKHKKNLNTEPESYLEPLDPPHKTVTDYNISNDIKNYKKVWSNIELNLADIFDEL